MSTNKLETDDAIDIEVLSRMLKKHTSSMYDFKTSKPEIDVNFESLCNDLA